MRHPLPARLIPFLTISALVAACNERSFDGVPVSIDAAITGPTTHFHIVSSDDFADLSWFEVDPAGGGTFGSLLATRFGPTNNLHTFLHIFVLQCDAAFQCNSIREGDGLIPNNDLSGGSRSFNLRTNTTGNPNFVTYTGPTGVVSVDWRANGLYTARSAGTSELSFPDVTHRSQGSSTTVSANGTGSVLGLSISPNGAGEIGTNHATTIDITHGNSAGLAATLQPRLVSNVDGVPLLAAGAGTNVTTQVHYVANGDVGALNWIEADPAGGRIFGSLTVSRGGPTNNPQTFLSYVVERCADVFNCTSILAGAGLVPNSDLSGGGRSLTLTTNTTGNPNFVAFAGPTGAVSVDWRANGLFTQRSTGTSQVSFPNFSQRSQGSFTTVFANATGSIVGLSIPANSFADIGTNHQMTIDFIRSLTVGP